jgi:hypothetical protein
MLIYPDTRDLINFLARDQPVPPAELRRILREHDSQLVYSFSNTIETVNVVDRAQSRERLITLEQLPKTFILGLPALMRIEFTQDLMGTLAK